MKYNQQNCQSKKNQIKKTVKNFTEQAYNISNLQYKCTFLLYHIQITHTLQQC